MKADCKNQKHILDNDDGIAMFEGLVFLMAFVILTAYAIDTFTAVHTGIVNSIAARTYAFETFEHRANLRYLRFSDEKAGPGSKTDFFGLGHQRFHAVEDEDEDSSDSTIRDPGRRLTAVNPQDQGRQMSSSTSSNSSNKTDVIYVKAGYGICLDASCPPDGG